VIATEKLKRYRSPGMDHLPAKLIGGNTLCSEIHKLIISIWNEEELPEQQMESIVAHIYKKGDKTDCTNYRRISLLSTTNKISFNIPLSRRNYLGS
jgi:hypothetical protein